LLVLSMLMTRLGDEEQILRMASTAVQSLGPCRSEAIYLDGSWHPAGTPSDADCRRKVLESETGALGSQGGPMPAPEGGWSWAYSLSSPGGPAGYLVVTAAHPPRDYEQFLLQVLAQQTGVALANARLHVIERHTADELWTANVALRRSMEIHQRLTEVAVRGEGQDGIARAVHQLTGYPVAVEDRYGNLRAWAGPNQPHPYPKGPPWHRAHVVHKALEAGRPIREDDRLLTVTPGQDEPLGVLAIIDPDGSAGEVEQTALEHGGTVLAMELSRLKSLVETELRLRRDLVEELLTGADEVIALNRAQALGYDLGRSHRVVVIEWVDEAGVGDSLFHAVERAAREEKVGSLMVARSGSVVLIADTEALWDDFWAAVQCALGRGSCRIGVGGQCRQFADFARSYREAKLALKMQQVAGGRAQATVFEDLGIYQVLAQVEDTAAVERLVQRWLGALLDHDAHKGSQLVETLSEYVEHGGSYDATAKALAVHRSTLKYRLQRIREVTGYDLADPDIHFNLHLASRAWRTLRVLRDGT
jgi:sugar diacid utilization regulator